MPYSAKNGRDSQTRLQILQNRFPPLTSIEKFFVGAFLLSGLLFLIANNRHSMTKTQSTIVLCCAWLMSCVVGYWMWHEPGPMLQSVLFYYLFGGYRIQFPRVVLLSVRVLGLVGFAGSMLAFPITLMPSRFNQGIALLVILVVDIAVCVWALRKRRDLNVIVDSRQA